MAKLQDRALDRASDVGSLEPGKLADAVLVRGDATDLLHVPTPIAGVLKRGQLVAGTMGSS
jgi:imidazolonepropionase-like amidohydrolase